MSDYAMILTTKFPDREWTLNGNNYDSLQMIDGKPEINQGTLDSLWPEVQTEIEAKNFAREKAKETALEKLVELGLTKAEINALLGI